LSWGASIGEMNNQPIKDHSKKVRSISGVGSCSKLGGGLFKLSGHICMEKITLWSDSKNWGLLPM